MENVYKRVVVFAPKFKSMLLLVDAIESVMISVQRDSGSGSPRLGTQKKQIVEGKWTKFVLQFPCPKIETR